MRKELSNKFHELTGNYFEIFIDYNLNTTCIVACTDGKRKKFTPSEVKAGVLSLVGWPADIPVRKIGELTKEDVRKLWEVREGLSLQLSNSNAESVEQPSEDSE